MTVLPFVRTRRGSMRGPFATTAPVLALVLGSGAVGGCGAETTARSVAAPPPIVLITADGLRADVVGHLGGLPGLTPHLDRFLAGATFAGSAIAATTDPAAAALSLSTGLLPAQHGALHRGDAVLIAERETLAEALAARGYRTVAFAGGTWIDAGSGHAAGFAEWRDLAAGRDAADFLARLADEPVFVWIDLDVPTFPLRRFPALLPRLAALGDRVVTEGLPDRVGAFELAEALERPGDPSELERRRWFALYCLNVARADVRIGELLGALAGSPAGRRAVVAVASARGEPVGDRAAGGPGLLRSAWIEVPVGVAVGDAAPTLEVQQAAPIAIAGLHATLLELAGGQALPATARSYWHRRGPDGVLSELWGARGLEELSWVSTRDDGGLEQVWRGVTAGETSLDAGATAELAGWLWSGGSTQALPSADTSRLDDALRRHRLLVVGDEAPRPTRKLRPGRGAPATSVSRH